MPESTTSSSIAGSSVAYPGAYPISGSVHFDDVTIFVGEEDNPPPLEGTLHTEEDEAYDEWKRQRIAQLQAILAHHDRIQNATDVDAVNVILLPTVLEDEVATGGEDQQESQRGVGEERGVRSAAMHLTAEAKAEKLWHKQKSERFVYW